MYGGMGVPLAWYQPVDGAINVVDVGIVVFHHTGATV